MHLKTLDKKSKQNIKHSKERYTKYLIKVKKIIKQNRKSIKKTNETQSYLLKKVNRIDYLLATFTKKKEKS